jgi:hypothetical protein
MSFISREVEHFFMSLLAICTSSFENSLFNSSAIYSLGPKNYIRINETKSLFFKMIKKIYTPLAIIPKWWWEKTQINKIRDEKKDITTNTNKIQRTIREYVENLYSSKLKNLHEMDRFLGAYIHPKLNHEDTKYLNSSIACNKIEAVIKSPSKEEPRTGWIHN